MRQDFEQTDINVQRFAAFAAKDVGGNPAGVVICDQLPPETEMRNIAKQVGYSETVFAARTDSGFRVRYFAPDAEIPFCGHATIALGAAIAKRGNLSPVELQLNSGSAMVQGSKTGSQLKAVLWSSRTRHTAAAPELISAAHDLFGFSPEDFDSRYPPAVIEAGARHLLLCLKDRDQLARMNYDLVSGAKLMRDWGLATINLVYEEKSGLFHSRNAFASGGVFEDPATGAAAAALVAYLAELDGSVSRITVLQGYDMGVPCVIHAEAPQEAGGSARVEGLVREIEE